MKSLVVLCLLFVAVWGLPAKKTEYDDSDSDESFFLFPLGRQHKKQVPSVVEVEVGGDSDEDSTFFPSFRPLFINPFSFMNFGFSDFFSRSSWFDSLIPRVIPEDAVKNSTSSTKVVDGHKITVNETTYENEKNGAVYRFQIIDISPIDKKEKGEKPVVAESTPDVAIEKEQPEQPEQHDIRTETTEDVKPDQNSQDNEIHREEQMIENYELQGDEPSTHENIETFDYSSGHQGKKEKLMDLSSDIRINRIRAENARRAGLFMIPPEVEVFGILDYDVVPGNYQQEAIEGQEIVEPQLKRIIRPQYNPQARRLYRKQELIAP